MATGQVDGASAAESNLLTSLYRGLSLGDFTVPCLYALSIGDLSNPTTNTFPTINFKPSVGSWPAAFDPTTEKPETIGDIRRLLQYLQASGILPNKDVLHDDKAHDGQSGSAYTLSSGTSPPTSETEGTFDAARFLQESSKPESSPDTRELRKRTSFSIEEFRTLCGLLEENTKQSALVPPASESPHNAHGESVPNHAHSGPKSPEPSDLALPDLGKYPLHHRRAPNRPHRRTEIDQQYGGMGASQQGVFSPLEQQPLPNIHITETAEEPKAKLANKSGILFREAGDISAGTAYDGGIHVFVDYSNINIGFHDKVKANRGLRSHQSISQVPINFEALDAIFSRGRPVARRVLVGSVKSQGNSNRLDKSLMNAKKQGYEVNILERVRKLRVVPDKRSARAAIAGYSSASEGPSRGVVQESEQGVDEILHLKILESIIDTEKASTMIIASGDAAPAEYSGGFMKMIERALARGWKVEVVSWRENLNFLYRDGALQRIHGPRFDVILLDDFAEDLVSMAED